MFKSARIKLTAWYLLIIMAVSLFFSAAIYRGVGMEFRHRLEMIEGRLRGEGFQMRLPPRSAIFFLDDLEAAKERVFLMLVWANGVILVFSAAAGWFLAGRTLAPIEKAMEEQKRFVADASHELRTPLTALKTSLEVGLRDKKLDLREAKLLLKSNLEEVEGMHTLSNNLLGLARLQANSHVLEFENVSAREMAKSVRRKIESMAKLKKVDLKLKVESVEIRVNRASFEELLVILLDNAIKYTPAKGKVSLKIGRSKGRTLFEVADTGIGISSKDLPHIFDRFYRADQSRSKNQVAGYGLGLALAKKIVKLHGGTIKVESRLGKRSIFTVIIPQN